MRADFAKALLRGFECSASYSVGSRFFAVNGPRCLQILMTSRVPNSPPSTASTASVSSPLMSWRVSDTAEMFYLHIYTFLSCGKLNRYSCICVWIYHKYSDSKNSDNFSGPSRPSAVGSAVLVLNQHLVPLRALLHLRSQAAGSSVFPPAVNLRLGLQTADHQHPPSSDWPAVPGDGPEFFAGEFGKRICSGYT